jgi:hypothetical protein
MKKNRAGICSNCKKRPCGKHVRDDKHARGIYYIKTCWICRNKLLGPTNRKNIRLKCVYQITLLQFRAQRRIQRNCCALCCTPFKGTPLVDHNSKQCGHRREKGCPSCVRGLLCFRCNCRVLPILEKCPHLQSQYVKKYLQQRPFKSTVSSVTKQDTLCIAD